MRIIDTYPAIISAFCGDRAFETNAWKEYANSISPSLAEKVLRDSEQYDTGKEVIPVIENALAENEKMEETHSSFLAATAGLGDKIIKAVSVDMEVDIILYLGLCNGAGWATTLDSRHTILLGIEKIVELGWCNESTITALIYHELGHIWHDTVGTLYCESQDAGDRAVWQLFQEGIAMYFEQLILGDFAHYHQDRDGWLNWCEANRSGILEEYRRRVATGESVQSFFGDWCEYERHSDVGYFLGCEFVKFLLERYSFEELAKLDVRVVREELFAY